MPVRGLSDQAREAALMTVDEGANIVKTCGAEETSFFGDVFMKIRGGTVTMVKVSQEFIAGST
jgi:hypothetical protein